jgi:hypothetical protein
MINRYLLRNFLITMICATLTCGGTFTCKSESDSDSHTQNPRTGVR